RGEYEIALFRGLSARVAAADVAANFIQPAVNSCGIVDAIQAAPGLQQRLLHHILSRSRRGRAATITASSASGIVRSLLVSITISPPDWISSLPVSHPSPFFFVS